MLLPRYSLRTILLGTAACAVFFLILGQALQGAAWAIVISVGWASLIVTLVFHGLLFLLVAYMSRLVGTGQLPAQTSQGGLQAQADGRSKAPPPTGADHA